MCQCLDYVRGIVSRCCPLVEDMSHCRFFADYKPTVPLEKKLFWQFDILDNPASYLPYWGYDHVAYWLRARTRASERTRGNES